MIKTAIALGTNLGHRFDLLRQAVTALQKDVLTHIRLSVVYETHALLPENADPAWNKPYLNMVVIGDTQFEPLTLLKKLKNIEKKLGRKEAPVWSPRLMDLDILLYGDQKIQSDILTIPHKGLLERDFMLLPLSQLEPLWTWPDRDSAYFGQPLQGLMHGLNIINNKNNIFSGASFSLFPECVGIMNITPDSFSDGGELMTKDQITQKFLHLIDSGASVIDLGGQSTRPGAKLLDAAEEAARIFPALEILKEIRDQHPEPPQLSLDTMHAVNAEQAIKNFGCDWINDQSVVPSKDMLKLMAESGVKYINMHALTIPPDKNTIIPLHQDPVLVIDKWAKTRLELLYQSGILAQNIILDPGIGFGKTAYQNRVLLNNNTLGQHWGVKILIGHSRKSYMNFFAPPSFAERDLETALLTALSDSPVNYWRVHDVEKTRRALTVRNIIQQGYKLN